MPSLLRGGAVSPELRLGVRVWVGTALTASRPGRIPTWSLASWVTLSKALSLSEPQFPRQPNGNRTTCLAGILWGLPGCPM